MNRSILPVSRWRSERGFSMVEITLALGVVGLALVVILGLMPSGINASRRVADETTITTLAGDMMHWRRVTPYTSSPYMPAGATSLLGRADYDHEGATVTNYFDLNGYLPVLSDNVTTNPSYAGPYYRFLYTVQNHPQFGSNMDIAQLVVRVDWPCINTGTTDPPPGLATNYSTRVFVSTYTRKP